MLLILVLNIIFVLCSQMIFCADGKRFDFDHFDEMVLSPRPVDRSSLIVLDRDEELIRRAVDVAKQKARCTAATFLKVVLAKRAYIKSKEQQAAIAAGLLWNDSTVRAAVARVVTERKLESAGIKREREKDNEFLLESDDESLSQESIHGKKKSTKRRLRERSLISGDEDFDGKGPQSSLQAFIAKNEELARTRTYLHAPSKVDRYPGAAFIERFLKLIDREFGSARGGSEALQKKFPGEYESYVRYRQEVFAHYKARRERSYKSKGGELSSASSASSD